MDPQAIFTASDAIFNRLGGAPPITASPMQEGFTFGAKATPAAKPLGFIPSVIGSAARFAGEFAGLAAAPFEGALHFGQNIGQIESGNMNLSSITQSQQALDRQMQQAISDYHAGRISKQSFDNIMKTVQGNYEDLSNQSKNIKFPSTSEFLGNAAYTAAAALSGGALSTAEAEAGSAASRAGKFLGASTKAIAPGNRIEEFLGAGNTLGSMTKAALKLPFKTALITGPTAGMVPELYDQLSKGNFSKAAETIGTVAALQAGGAYGGDILRAGKGAVFGDSGVLDRVFGSGIRDYLKQHPEWVDTAKLMQQFTLNDRAARGSDAAGAEHLRNHLIEELGYTPKDLTNPKKYGEFFQTAKNYYTVLGKLQVRAARAGLDGRWVITHDVKGYAGKVATRYAAALKENPEIVSNLEARQSVITHIMENLGIQDKTLERQITEALGIHGDSIEGARAALGNIKSLKTIPLKTVNAALRDGGQKGIRLPKGFAVTAAPQGVHLAELPRTTEGINLRLGQEPLPAFRKFASAAQAAGLSPNATSGNELTNLIRNNFTTEMRKQNLSEGAREIHPRTILQRLNQLLGTKPGAFDARALNVGEIKNFLGPKFSPSDARAVQRALQRAYSKLPGSKIGYPNKLANVLIEKSPFNVEARYLRLQGLARYEKNPIFTAKQIIKSALIAIAQGADPTFKMSRDTEQALESAGYFNKGRLDQAARDWAGEENLKLASPHQINGVLKHIAGSYAETLARANGKTVKQIFAEGGPLSDELQHGIDTILSYPKGGYLQSPLARSLNIIIFPSRFDTKVLTVAAKALVKAGPVAQVGIINDLANLHDFINSQAGQQWVANNADFLGLIKYFTPVGTIADLMSFFSSGKFQDLGSIGGLPLGVITTIMQHQGLDLGPFGQSPYVNPQTGQITTSIPQSIRARFQQAGIDLVNSIYNYPGKVAGLSPKTTVTTTALPFLKQNSKEVQKTVTPAQPTAATTPLLSPLPKLQGNVRGAQPISSNATLPSNYKAGVTGKKAKAKKGKLPKIVPANERISNSLGL